MTSSDKQTIIDSIDEIVSQIQLIQKSLRGTAQPATSTEIDKLKQLGTEYSVLIKKLDQSSD